MLTLTWENCDGVILHLHSTPQWTWQQYFAELRATLPTLIAPHRVDVIFSIEDGTGIAPGFIRHAEQADDLNGINVIVGGGGYIETVLGLLKLASQARGSRYFVAPDIAEARALIQLQRQQLLLANPA